MSEVIQMAEYISKAEAIESIMQTYCPNCDSCNGIMCKACGYKDCMDIVDDVKSADVQPIKHGRWIPQGDDMWLCSNCKENKIFSMHESDRTEKQRYCCRCGARMDGDSK